MSLLYTATSLDRNRFSPIIALARPSTLLQELYESAGIETLSAPGIALWDHSTVAPRPLSSPRTWSMLLRLAAAWKSTGRETLALVKASRADLVHLNSMPLSASAKALSHDGFPFVWHVREPPLPAKGLRYRVIRRIMEESNALVFISDADREAWTGGKVGEVIRNFVDVQRFHPSFDGSPVRAQHAISDLAPVVLYMGGVNETKGVFQLLDALSLLKETFPDLRCLMPGVRAASAPHTGWKGVLRGVRSAIGPLGVFDRRVSKLDLSSVIVEVPFSTDVRVLIAASNVVVFPATQPHFARPAIEAAAMAKPVIASRFPITEELVVDGTSGLLVAPRDAGALADALRTVLDDPLFAKRLGLEGRRVATERFNSERQVARLMSLYDQRLANRAR